MMCGFYKAIHWYAAAAYKKCTCVSAYDGGRKILNEQQNLKVKSQKFATHEKSGECLVSKEEDE